MPDNMLTGSLYNGDCMEILPLLQNNSVDLILCDLPYGITECAWDKVLPMADLWREYNRIIKDDGAIVLTATMKFAIDLINANRKYFRYEWVWEKSMGVGFANSHKMPLRKHELILVFYKRLPTYNPQGLVKLDRPKSTRKGNVAPKHNSVYKDSTLRNEYTTAYTNYPSSVLKFGNCNHGSMHPTQKPLEMFEYLVRTYSNEGDLVLDNCAGSGTTLVACLRNGRRYIGIEQDAGYYETAKLRLLNGA